MPQKNRTLHMTKPHGAVQTDRSTPGLPQDHPDGAQGQPEPGRGLVEARTLLADPDHHFQKSPAGQGGAPWSSPQVTRWLGQP